MKTIPASLVILGRELSISHPSGWCSHVLRIWIKMLDHIRSLEYNDCPPQTWWLPDFVSTRMERSHIHCSSQHLASSQGFPGGSVGKESACNVGDLGSIPGLGRSPGEGNGNPLQYSCLENPMDGGAWWATVHRSQKVGHDWETSFSLSAFFIVQLSHPSMTTGKQLINMGIFVLT